ncbi:MAG: tRNA A-37 threonylcarbamoyl transferase component Bud32 [Pseudomonadales bacterium]|jgi:tRNA A-37 threonylcarbamoyl transferase component Bud32
MQTAAPFIPYLSARLKPQSGLNTKFCTPLSFCHTAPMFYIAPKYRHWFTQQQISSYKQLLTLCQGEVINHAGKNTTWRNSWQIDDSTFKVFIKRYEYRLSPRYTYPRRPRALVEMQSYNFWQQHNIAGPEVIAAGSYSPFGFHQSSLIITREIAGAEDLSELCQLPCFRQNSILVETVFDQLADILANAHQANFYHFDLHFRNIMVQKKAQAPTIFWIDAPRGKIKKKPNAYLQIKDLACIYRGCYGQQWLSLWQQLAARYFQQMGYDQNTVNEIKQGIKKRLGRRKATSQHGDEQSFV